MKHDWYTRLLKLLGFRSRWFVTCMLVMRRPVIYDSETAALYWKEVLVSSLDGIILAPASSIKASHLWLEYLSKAFPWVYIWGLNLQYRLQDQIRRVDVVMEIWAACNVGKPIAWPISCSDGLSINHMNGTDQTQSFTGRLLWEVLVITHEKKKKHLWCVFVVGWCYKKQNKKNIGNKDQTNSIFMTFPVGG